MKTNKNGKQLISSLTALEELQLLLSNSEKEAVRIENEKRDDQLKEANKRIAAIKPYVLDSAKGAFK